MKSEIHTKMSKRTTTMHAFFGLKASALHMLFLFGAPPCLCTSLSLLVEASTTSTATLECEIGDTKFARYYGEDTLKQVKLKRQNQETCDYWVEWWHDPTLCRTNTNSFWGDARTADRERYCSYSPNTIYDNGGGGQVCRDTCNHDQALPPWTDKNGDPIEGDCSRNEDNSVMNENEKQACEDEKEREAEWQWNVAFMWRVMFILFLITLACAGVYFIYVAVQNGVAGTNYVANSPKNRRNADDILEDLEFGSTFRPKESWSWKRDAGVDAKRTGAASNRQETVKEFVPLWSDVYTKRLNMPDYKVRYATKTDIERGPWYKDELPNFNYLDQTLPRQGDIILLEKGPGWARGPQPWEIASTRSNSRHASIRSVSTPPLWQNVNQSNSLAGYGEGVSPTFGGRDSKQSTPRRGVPKKGENFGGTPIGSRNTTPRGHGNGNNSKQNTPRGS